MNDVKGIIEDVEKSSLISDKVIKKVIEIIGQKEWNGIHDEEDDICTTTGELIITLKGIAELEKENAELKCECRRCVYTDCPCILSDYGKDRNGICNHFKDVFDENAELKEENQKWKGEWQEQVQKANDEGYARTLQTMQLTKAKELLAKWVELYKPKSETALPTPIQVVTEQFLKE